MKKVTTYGRKKTGFIAVHADFSPVRPSAVSASLLLTPVAKRPALSAKPSSGNIGVIPSPASPQYDDEVKQDKGRALLRVAKEDTKSASTTPEVVGPRRARAGKSAGGLPGGTAVPPLKTERAARRKKTVPEVVIEPRVSRTVRGAPTLDDQTLERLSALKITETALSALNPVVPPSTITDMAQICSSPQLHTFSGFLSSSTFLEHAFQSLGRPSIRKIGEASYSEVFGVRIVGKPEVVVKVVPLLAVGTEPTDGLPDCSRPADVQREIEMTRRMGEMPSGSFTKMLGAFVVKGRYPADLLTEWDRYKRTEGSASTRPDTFTKDQHYALMVLPHGGPDLEAFEFSLTTPWTEVLSIFRQTVHALAEAERLTRFEHRDLHEGQILISRPPIDLTSSISDVGASELEVTIIDLGLSRLTTGHGRELYSEPPEDVFDGTGEQWDVYRATQELSGGDWRGFYPKSNAMWLCYLLGYMAHNKSIRKPRPIGSAISNRCSPIKSDSRSRHAASPRPAHVRAMNEDSNCAAYETVVVLEKMLIAGGLKPTGTAAIKGKKAKKGEAPVRELRSAADVWSILNALSGAV